MWTPFALARARPSPVRALINSRSQLEQQMRYMEYRQQRQMEEMQHRTLEHSYRRDRTSPR
jgi:hypothetical protein